MSQNDEPSVMQESELGAWENGQAPSQEDLVGNPKGSLLGDGYLGSAVDSSGTLEMILGNMICSVSLLRPFSDVIPHVANLVPVKHMF